MKIRQILEESEQLFKILQIIDSLGLKDAWLSAGTLRNLIWNKLSGYTDFNQMSDIDVVFFDDTVSYEKTCQLEQSLRKNYPEYIWELKNQVYMHIHSPETSPYTSSCDAVSKYPEKCTAIAARLDKNHKLELFLPYGENDILNFIVSPTPHFLENPKRMKVYEERQTKKNWKGKWPNLEIKGLDSK